jgi:hypothetical protein
MSTQTPWLVLLCKFNDDATPDPNPPEFYQALFRNPNVENVVSYWNDITYGEMDLTGSDVRGWLRLDQNRADYLGLPTRLDLVNWAKQKATDSGINVGDYYGVIVYMSVRTDLFGSAGRFVVCDIDSNLAQIQQEVGHGYGLQHSRSVASPTDYQNPYCIMSGLTFGGSDPTFIDNRFGQSGPGLCSPFLFAQGWLPESRIVRVATNGRTPAPTELTLAPLGERNPAHPQVAIFGFDSPQELTYFVEYRAGGWDRGLAQNAIVIHQMRSDGLAYYAGQIPTSIGFVGGMTLLPGVSFVDPQFDLAIDVLTGSNDGAIKLRIAPAGWRRFPIAPDGSALVRGAITAVSRIPTSMETFWVGATGSIEDAFWYEGMDRWGRFPIAPPGSASLDGGIAAVSRIPTSMEVFWVGADGSVQDAYWYEGMDHWGRFTIAPAGSASPKSGVAAVSRAPNSMEIFWIGANGSVQDAFWYEGKDHWGRLELAPAGSASLNGGITAVSRIANSMEVFWVGAAGSVEDAFWYEGMNRWGRFPIAPAGSASATGGITAVSRIPTSMEVHWVGAAGSVEDAFWYEGMDHWGRFPIAPPGSASTRGGISAISRVPTSMEIFWVGAAGSVEDAFWYEGMDHWGRFAIARDGSASLDAGIAAVSRIPKSMETWWTGTNGSIQDAFWYE